MTAAKMKTPRSDKDKDPKSARDSLVRSELVEAKPKEQAPENQSRQAAADKPQQDAVVDSITKRNKEETPTIPAKEEPEAPKADAKPARPAQKEVDAAQQSASKKVQGRETAPSNQKLGRAASKTSISERKSVGPQPSKAQAAASTRPKPPLR